MREGDRVRVKPTGETGTLFQLDEKFALVRLDEQFHMRYIPQQSRHPTSCLRPTSTSLIGYTQVRADDVEPEANA